jgi:hypothetical protein
MSLRLPKLPQLLDRKVYKTGQTRGADDDVIYQNRVNRNSTVLIPFSSWKKNFKFPDEAEFENGFIVLITPEEYFENSNIHQELRDNSLILGENAVLFYETRGQWEKYNPESKGYSPAESRVKPLRGTYVARVPGTTATERGEKIVQGYSTTTTKGAGIRVYEYASSKVIKLCRLQLEAIFWHCHNSSEITLKHGMSEDDIRLRKIQILSESTKSNLLDYSRLITSRILNKNYSTICPLCLEILDSEGFFTRMKQASGRVVPDITVTEINLFHIKELKTGEYNHCPYNVGWGHHHCNVVCRDTGIEDTIAWINRIIEKNREWKLSE